MNIKWVIKRVIKSCSWLLLTLWFPAGMVVTAGTASANEPFGMFKDTASLEPDRVLVLLAEVENCSFCKRVKNDFLLPLTLDPKWEPLFQVRRIDLNSQAIVTDFTAQKISQQELSQAFNADFSPTVMFIHPRTGQRIGEDIVGLVTPDFYGFYLQQQITQSYNKITGQL